MFRLVQSCCKTSKHRHSRWNFVAIMCASWDIRYFISTSGSKPPSSILHPPWCRAALIFVPLCCLVQKICGLRWNFTYIPPAISGISASGFPSTILISGWTCIELCTGRCCYMQQRWLRHPQKQMQYRWICFQRWFTPIDSMVTKFVTFSPKNHPHRLYFRWRNSITGWTISKISTSFHQALIALGLRQAQWKIPTGNWDIQEKRRGSNFAPRRSRVNGRTNSSFMQGI